MAPVEAQKAPVVVWMSDAEEAEEDAGAATLLPQTVQPSHSADSQPWYEGGRERGERKERRKGRREGGREVGRQLPSPSPTKGV